MILSKVFNTRATKLTFKLSKVSTTSLLYNMNIINYFSTKHRDYKTGSYKNHNCKVYQFNENYVEEDLGIKYAKLELQRTFGFVNLIEKLPYDSDILNKLNEIRLMNYIYIFKRVELSTYRKIETRNEINNLINKYKDTEYKNLLLYILEYYKLN